jgi:hypothetical protein
MSKEQRAKSKEQRAKSEPALGMMNDMNDMKDKNSSERSEVNETVSKQEVNQKEIRRR